MGTRFEKGLPVQPTAFSIGLASQTVFIAKPRLDIRFSSNRGALVASLEGDIVSRTAGTLRDGLIEQIVLGTRYLVVDLTAVRTVTRAGLGGLIVAAKLVYGAGGGLRICGADRKARALLSGQRLDHLIRLDASVEESLSALHDPTRCHEIAPSIAEALCRPAREKEPRP